jgi:hypothetical protein
MKKLIVMCGLFLFMAGQSYAVSTAKVTALKVYVSTITAEAGVDQVKITTDVVVEGDMTATSFSGSASGLTSIPAGQLTGAVPTASVNLSTVTTAINAAKHINVSVQIAEVSTGTFIYANYAVTCSSVTVVIKEFGEGGSTGTVWAVCDDSDNCTTTTTAAGAAVGTEQTGTGAGVSIAANGKIYLRMRSSDETVTPTGNVTGICK